MKRLIGVALALALGAASAQAGSDPYSINLAVGEASLELALGFSHPVIVNAPEGITFDVPAPDPGEDLATPPQAQGPGGADSGPAARRGRRGRRGQVSAPSRG
jgi:hypothetical protein